MSLAIRRKKYFPLSPYRAKDFEDDSTDELASMWFSLSVKITLTLMWFQNTSIILHLFDVKVAPIFIFSESLSF